MSRLIFVHEWKRLLRSPRLVAMLLVVLAGLVATSWWSADTDAGQQSMHHRATEQARSDWLGRGEAHPHSMAHFGDFVFRPNGPLARIDSGVQASMGRVLRVEGHRRGSPLIAASDAAGPLARFGRFDPAFLLQHVVPLIVIVIGIGLSPSDGRRGQMQWMLAHGAPGCAFAFGRTAFLTSIGAILLAGVVVAALVVSPASWTLDDGVRLAGLAVTYLAFFVVVAAGSTLVSSAARSTTSGAFVLLALWVVGTTVLPRATASIADVVAPLPTRDAFETAMREAREAEIDGHNPEDVRLQELEAELLAKYEVETREELPINFDGVAMQVDEEVGNVVWDEHFGRLEDTFHRQGAVARAASLVNPFQAVRSLSMTLSGTDLAHDLSFQDAVETYRRNLVEALNNEHAYGGSTTGDRSFKADAAFYAGLSPFAYEANPIGTMIGGRSVEVAGLAGWAVLLIVGLAAAGRGLQQRGRA